MKLKTLSLSLSPHIVEDIFDWFLFYFVMIFKLDLGVTFDLLEWHSMSIKFLS